VRHGTARLAPLEAKVSDVARASRSRHTKLEVVATELAAGLRYAEASITRAPGLAPDEDDDVN
jgi:hypothetical protein